jgi:hypothetical protein
MEDAPSGRKQGGAAMDQVTQVRRWAVGQMLAVGNTPRAAAECGVFDASRSTIYRDIVQIEAKGAPALPPLIGDLAWNWLAALAEKFRSIGDGKSITVPGHPPYRYRFANDTTRVHAVSRGGSENVTFLVSFPILVESQHRECDKQNVTRTCAYCGAHFESRRKDTRYCSPVCRATDHRRRTSSPPPSPPPAAADSGEIELTDIVAAAGVPPRELDKATTRAKKRLRRQGVRRPSRHQFELAVLTALCTMSPKIATAVRDYERRPCP